MKSIASVFVLTALLSLVLAACGEVAEPDPQPEPTPPAAKDLPPVKVAPVDVKPLDMKPLDVKPVAPGPKLEVAPMKPKTLEVAFTTETLAGTGVSLRLPKGWTVKESGTRLFTVTAGEDGHVLIRTSGEKAAKIGVGRLGREGAMVAGGLPRTLVYVKGQEIKEVYKEGAHWYKEALFRRKKGGGRMVRAVSVMNQNGTARAHCFLYSLNDTGLPKLQAFAKSVTIE